VINRQVQMGAADEHRDIDGADGDVAAEFVQRCDAGEFTLPLPGAGRTSVRLSCLRRIGHRDLAVARLGEGHADALAILAEAGTSAPPEARLGVWAAGPVSELSATPTSDGWCLDGRRRWCSGAFIVTHGIVTASAPDGDRLFLVPTSSSGFLPDPSSWPAVGMSGSGTFDVAFDSVVLPRAAEIGGPDFYLRRPGFWVGAIGVAAVWLGGAEAVARTLAERAGDDPHALAHLGAVYARLDALSAMLDRASETADLLLDEQAAQRDVPEGDATEDDAAREELELVARSVRAAIESGATEVLDRTGRATGATPLGHDAAHAQRVADLTVYLRQSHAERDLEALGALAHRLGHTDWSSR
jgi:alkylation response protein AidB-like acyl-CoA dehydrogenase